MNRYALAVPASLALFGVSFAAGVGIANADNLVPTGNAAITCPQGYPRTWCNDKVSTWVCDQHYIKLEGSGQFFQNPKVTCHETGHAAGLTHGNAAYPALPMNAPSLGCLRAPLEAITSNALGSSNVSQINAVY